MSRLESLQNSVGKARCDRCGFMFPVGELIEDEATGLVLDPKCVDREPFNTSKTNQSQENKNHHFKT